MSIVLTLILVLILFLLVKLIKSIIKLQEKLSGFVRPPGHWLWSHAAEFSSTTTIIPNLKKFSDQYGGMIRFDLCYCFPFLLISDVKFLESLLSSSKLIEKSDDYEFLKNWLGTGLLTSSPEKWHKTRKMLTPAFHFQILEQFVDHFEDPTKILLQKLDKKIGQEFDIYPIMSSFTLDMICETSMGIKVNTQLHEKSDYVNSVKELARISSERGFTALKQIEFFYMLSRDYRKEQKALKVVHGFTSDVIMSRREELLHTKREISQESENSENFSSKKKRLAFLDLMLASTIDGRSLTDEEIQHEVNTFMFAGHDTTATALTFILYCLSNNLEIQEKVFEEVMKIFNKNQKFTMESLHEMKYLEMVIKESLRLYPPAPMVARRVLKDEIIDGVTLPPGVAIGIWIYGLHRDPKIYPGPEKFDPERFTPANQAKRSPYSYIPFSAGPRNCIGQKFAMLEMKYTLAQLVLKYIINPVIDQKVVLSQEVVMKSKNGIKIKLEART